MLRGGLRLEPELVELSGSVLELLEVEEGSKWTLFTIARVQELLASLAPEPERSALLQECADNLRKLVDIDPDHRHYYEHRLLATAQ